MGTPKKRPPPNSRNKLMRKLTKEELNGAAMKMDVIRAQNQAQAKAAADLAQTARVGQCVETLLRTLAPSIGDAIKISLSHACAMAQECQAPLEKFEADVKAVWEYQVKLRETFEAQQKAQKEAIEKAMKANGHSPAGEPKVLQFELQPDGSLVQKNEGVGLVVGPDGATAAAEPEAVASSETPSPDVMVGDAPVEGEPDPVDESKLEIAGEEPPDADPDGPRPSDADATPQ